MTTAQTGGLFARSQARYSSSRKRKIINAIGVAHDFTDISGRYQPIPMLIRDSLAHWSGGDFHQRRKFLRRELYALKKSAGFRFHLCHGIEYAAIALALMRRRDKEQ